MLNIPIPKLKSKRKTSFAKLLTFESKNLSKEQKISAIKKGIKNQLGELKCETGLLIKILMNVFAEKLPANLKPAAFKINSTTM